MLPFKQILFKLFEDKDLLLQGKMTKQYNPIFRNCSKQ